MKRNFIITMALMMAIHTLSYAQADYLPTPTFDHYGGCIDDISGWEAVTPDGTKYTFSKVEKED